MNDFNNKKVVRCMKSSKIAIIGLGYVGLPLAVAFGKYREVLGFDIDNKRIDDLTHGHDYTSEVSESELYKANRITYTSDPQSLKNCNIFIVTVPTPINKSNKPDGKT